MGKLFEPLTLHGMTLKNRVTMSPMLMYMGDDDVAVTDRHFVHTARVFWAASAWS
jgi:NADPH2 dehydrogenase